MRRPAGSGSGEGGMGSDSTRLATGQAARLTGCSGGSDVDALGGALEGGPGRRARVEKDSA